MVTKIGKSYLLIMGATGLVFSQFIACGAEMYQVSMKQDYESETVNQAAYIPTSPRFGIHSPNGWASLPIAFKTGTHLSSEQVSELRKAMEIWELAVGKKLFSFQGVHTGIDGDSFKDLYSSLGDQINGNYADANWTKTGKPDQVLATTIWSNENSQTKRINTADIRFNMEHYIIGDSLKLKRTDNLEVVDMRSLALHELGHLLGLTHVNAENDRLSIMNPTLFIGEGLTTRRLSEDDIKRVQSIYGCEGESCDVPKIYDELTRMTEADASVAQK